MYINSRHTLTIFATFCWWLIVGGIGNDRHGPGPGPGSSSAPISNWPTLIALRCPRRVTCVGLDDDDGDDDLTTNTMSAGTTFG